jgi:hypothetical protein
MFVIAGVLWFGNVLTRRKLAGLACAIAGIIWYSVEQNRLSAATAASTEDTQDSNAGSATAMDTVKLQPTEDAASVNKAEHASILVDEQQDPAKAC